MTWLTHNNVYARYWYCNLKDKNGAWNLNISKSVGQTITTNSHMVTVYSPGYSDHRTVWANTLEEAKTAAIELYKKMSEETTKVA
jgi:hypothetical protein